MRSGCGVIGESKVRIRDRELKLPWYVLRGEGLSGLLKSERKSKTFDIKSK